LPEHAKKKEHKKEAADDLEKKAFVASFVLACAKQGITSPEAVAKAAERLVTVVKQAAEKQATGESVPGTIANIGLNTALLGTVGLPLFLGGSAGWLAGKMRNQSDTDDAELLRIQAEANAYRRRAAQSKTDAQVRKVVASDPKKYVVIG